MQEHVELWRVTHEDLVLRGICRFYEKGAMQTKADLPCCMCRGSDNVEEPDQLQKSFSREMDGLDVDGDGEITLVGLSLDMCLT